MAEKFAGSASSLSSHAQPVQEDQAEFCGIPDYSYDPDKAWVKEKLVKYCRPLKPLDWNTPKPSGHTRFVCISGEASIYLSSFKGYPINFSLVNHTPCRE